MPLRFPGQIVDAESGWHDNHHRSYDPNLGRYLQSDPIGLAAGVDTYGYVRGNPVSWVDTDGTRTPRRERSPEAPSAAQPGPLPVRLSALRLEWQQARYCLVV
jgi:RHS repeat-associated protein